MSKFFNNLRQPSKDIHGQHTQQTEISKCNFTKCDYLLAFQVEHKMSKSIFKKNWPKNTKDVEDDPCD